MRDQWPRPWVLATTVASCLCVRGRSRCHIRLKAKEVAVHITEVRIKLMDDASERLQAFCSITFDNAFVIRDLKIIDGSNGPFVAMPSRKLTAHCPACGYKNHL